LPGSSRGISVGRGPPDDRAVQTLAVSVPR
jgi:hypothetical protein